MIDSGYISAPEAVGYPTENGLSAYGFYYPPTNRDFSGPKGELPPLIVLVMAVRPPARQPRSVKVSILDQPGIRVLDVMMEAAPAMAVHIGSG